MNEIWSLFFYTSEFRLPKLDIYVIINADVKWMSGSLIELEGKCI